MEYLSKNAIFLAICLIFLLSLFVFPSFYFKVASPGFGWCGRCGITWKFADGHITDYGDEGRGVFPLCQKCWRELQTPENRMPYYKKLWESHGGEGHAEWSEIQKAVNEWR